MNIIEGDRKQLAFDYADAIHHEVAALIAAGCQVIQFDDPVLLRYPEAAQAWGLEALERCFAGLEDRATFVVHICRGYPNKPLERKGISYKANQDYYRDILSWLSESRLDVVSIEGAASNLDVSILSAIGKKIVMLGVIDVGENASRKCRVPGGARQRSPPLRAERATDSGAGLRHAGADSRERQREAHEPVAGGSRGQRAVKLVTYNIQYGLGKDNRYDLARIAREIEDADIIALQEVERHWQRSGCVDSPAVLAAQLPEHHWVYGANLDMDASYRDAEGRLVNRRRQFGTMILSRLPIVSSRNHMLPKYGTLTQHSIQQGALEAVIVDRARRPGPHLLDAPEPSEPGDAAAASRGAARHPYARARRRRRLVRRSSRARRRLDRRRDAADAGRCDPDGRLQLHLAIRRSTIASSAAELRALRSAQSAHRIRRCLGRGRTPRGRRRDIATTASGSTSAFLCPRRCAAGARGPHRRHAATAPITSRCGWRWTCKAAACVYKNKKRPAAHSSRPVEEWVGRVGIEPTTNGLRVRCSTS